MTILNNAVDTQVTNNEALAEALNRVQGIQGDFAKARGRKALALLIATGFVHIDYLLSNVSEADRSTILDRHQIKMRENANRFSPFIACLFGETDPKKDKIKGLDGREYPVWVPDSNYAVYFHTMEWCAERGFDHSTDVKKIAAAIAEEGAQTIANQRKARLSTAAKDEAKPTVEKHREVYLADGPAITVAIDGLDVPEGAGKFIAIIAERTGAGFVIRGVSDKNAEAKLNKLAGDEYDKLIAAREAAEERKRLKEELRAEMAAEQARSGFTLNDQVKIARQNVEAKLAERSEG